MYNVILVFTVHKLTLLEKKGCMYKMLVIIVYSINSGYVHFKIIHRQNVDYIVTELHLVYQCCNVNINPNKM